MQQVRQQVWRWAQCMFRQAEEDVSNVELLAFLAYFLVFLLVPGVGVSWQGKPVAGRVATVVCLVAWPLAIIAVRAWWFRGMRWPYRLASYLGWGLLAIELSFVTNMWLVVPRLGVPPQNWWLEIVVMEGFVLCSGGLVWLLRRQR